jgi:hypothetical protein
MSSRQSLFRFGRRNSTSFGAVALAAVLLSSAPAVAQGSRQKAADTLYSAGLEAHREGDLEEARDRYRDAFVLERAGYIAANLGQVEAKLGEWTAAAEHLAFALAKADHTPDARANLQRVFDVVKREVATVRIEAEVGGDEVLVNDRVVGRLPLTTPVFLNPGKYTILLRSDARTTEPKAIEVAKGQSYAVEFSAGGEGTFTRDAGASRKTRWELPVAITSGALAAGALTGGLLYLRSKSTRDDERADLIDRLGGDTACSGDAPAKECERIADLAQQGDRRKATAAAFFVASGAMLGTSIAATVLHFRHKRQDVAVAPVVDGKFFGIHAMMRF